MRVHCVWCSCMALYDLLRGRPLDDIVVHLPELWDTMLRVRDDIKESVRNAADLAIIALSKVRTSLLKYLTYLEI